RPSIMRRSTSFPYTTLFRSHWAQQHKRSPSFQWKRRIYDFEILYIQQGDIRAQLGGAEYVIPAGNLFYIPSGVHHAIQVVTEPRSEEHTSELQSRENLVCRL